jgi:hypothetical protein
MKRKRYSTEQIVAVIKQHERGMPAAESASSPERFESTDSALVSNHVVDGSGKVNPFEFGNERQKPIYALRFPFALERREKWYICFNAFRG